MRFLVILAAFALAAACTPTPAPAAPEPAPAPAPAEAASVDHPPGAAAIADEAACKSAGGNWQPVCRMQQPACVITYPDAGKVCTSGDQCTGDCVGTADGPATGQAAAGVCSANSDPCGCRTLIEDGMAVSAICVD